MTGVQIVGLKSDAILLCSEPPGHFIIRLHSIMAVTPALFVLICRTIIVRNQYADLQASTGGDQWQRKKQGQVLCTPF